MSDNNSPADPLAETVVGRDGGNTLSIGYGHTGDRIGDARRIAA